MWVQLKLNFLYFFFIKLCEQAYTLVYRKYCKIQPSTVLCNSKVWKSEQLQMLFIASKMQQKKACRVKVPVNLTIGLQFRIDLWRHLQPLTFAYFLVEQLRRILYNTVWTFAQFWKGGCWATCRKLPMQLCFNPVFDLLLVWTCQYLSYIMYVILVCEHLGKLCFNPAFDSLFVSTRIVFQPAHIPVNKRV